MFWVILLTLVIIVSIILFSNKEKHKNNINVISEYKDDILIIDQVPKYPLQFEKSIIISDDKLFDYIKCNVAIGDELKIDLKDNFIRFKKGNKILLQKNKNEYLDIINLFEYNHFFDVIKINNEGSIIEIIFGCFSDLNYSVFNTIHKSNKNFYPIEGYRYLTIDSISGAFVLDRKNYILEFCNEGDELLIKAEPSNYYDKNALQILHKDFVIGYVGQRRNIQFSKKIKNGYKMFIYGIEFNESTDFIDVSYIVYQKK